MRKLIFLTLLGIIILAGCTSTPIVPAVEDVSYPPIGETVTKSIGDILLSQGMKESYDAVEVLTDENRGRVPKGIYIATKNKQGYTIYEPHPSEFSLNRTLGNNFIAIKDGQMYYCAYGGYGNVFPYTKIPGTSYRITTAFVESRNNFQQLLIYTGKEQNIIKLSYREFAGDMARPAFTVDTTYDLDDSNEIAYRQARLKILEASNISITYIVLHNFD
jgi:hypothetical protein